MGEKVRGWILQCSIGMNSGPWGLLLFLNETLLYYELRHVVMFDREHVTLPDKTLLMDQYTVDGAWRVFLI